MFSDDCGVGFPRSDSPMPHAIPKDPCSHLTTKRIQRTCGFFLINGLLGKGRQLCCDHWYNSVGWAKKLLKRKTDLIGTLRRNRRGIPTQVKERRLKRGQLYYQQNKNGVLILKWKDKRDLLMISTCHDEEVSQSNKPVVVEDCKKFMRYVDQSDQIASYTPFARRTIKWYLRTFFHLVTQTAIVNSWTLFCDSNDKIKLNEFKMRIVESVLASNSTLSPRVTHKLEDIKVLSKKDIRKRCIGCYEDLAKKNGRTFAILRATKVSTRCSRCEKHYFLVCFQKIHRKCI